MILSEPCRALVTGFGSHPGPRSESLHKSVHGWMRRLSDRRLDRSPLQTPVLPPARDSSRREDASTPTPRRDRPRKHPSGAPEWEDSTWPMFEMRGAPPHGCPMIRRPRSMSHRYSSSTAAIPGSARQISWTSAASLPWRSCVRMAVDESCSLMLARCALASASALPICSAEARASPNDIHPPLAHRGRLRFEPPNQGGMHVTTSLLMAWKRALESWCSSSVAS